GRSYTVRVRAGRNDGAGNKCSAWTQAKSETAWTKPATPTMSTSGSGTKKSISWSVPASSNGRKITKVQIKVNNDGWQTANRSGSTSVEGYDKSLRVRVRAQNSEGVYSSVGDRSVTTSPKPKPKISITKGARISPEDIKKGSCRSGECWYIHIKVTDFPAGSVTCEYRSRKRDGSDNFPHYPLTMNVPKSGTAESDAEGFRGDEGNAQVKAVCDGIDSGWIDW